MKKKQTEINELLKKIDQNTLQISSLKEKLELDKKTNTLFNPENA